MESANCIYSLLFADASIKIFILTDSEIVAISAIIRREQSENLMAEGSRSCSLCRDIYLIIFTKTIESNYIQAVKLQNIYQIITINAYKQLMAIKDLTFENISVKPFYKGKIIDFPELDPPAYIDQEYRFNPEYQKAHQRYYNLLNTILSNLRLFINSHQQTKSRPTPPTPNSNRFNGNAILPPENNGQHYNYHQGRDVVALPEDMMAGIYLSPQLDELTRRLVDFENQLHIATTAEQLERLATDVARWAEVELEKIITVAKNLAQGFPNQVRPAKFKEQKDLAQKALQALSKLRADNPRELMNRTSAVVR